MERSEALRTAERLARNNFERDEVAAVQDFAIGESTHDCAKLSVSEIFIRRKTKPPQALKSCEVRVSVASQTLRRRWRQSRQRDEVAAVQDFATGESAHDCAKLSEAKFSSGAKLNIKVKPGDFYKVKKK